jgi:ribose transport system permease protein
MTATDARRAKGSAVLRNLSFGNIGAIYTWILIIAVFWIWVPDIFPTMQTMEAIANNFSIGGLAALAILVPIASGTFDASVGGTISLCGVSCAWFFANTSWSMGVIIAMTLLVGLAVGLFNALAVVVLRIPALIATLATWLIADALSVAVSGNQTITDARLSDDLIGVAQTQVHDFTLPVLYVLILATILGVALTQTAGGRFVYAVGFDPQVSRLAGVRVKAIQTGALLCSGLIGAFAGIVLTSQVASATPNGGDSYLLPAFAAAFLGATQFRRKRFNSIGTVIAVFMLGTGQYGLLLAGAPQWTPNVFQGLALVAAIGLTQVSGSGMLRGRRRPWSRRPAPAAPERATEELDDAPAVAGSLRT